MLAGCLDAPAGPAPRPRPTIDAAIAGADPHNVLTHRLGTRSRSDSIAVRFEPPADESVAAAVSVNADVASFPCSDSHRRAVRPCGTRSRTRPSGTTVGRTLRVDDRRPPGGSAALYRRRIGSLTGTRVRGGHVRSRHRRLRRIVWSYRFPTGPGLNFSAQPDGWYFAVRPRRRRGTSSLGGIEPLGTVTRTLASPARGLQPRLHDLIAGWIHGGAAFVLAGQPSDERSGARPARQVAGTVAVMWSGHGRTSTAKSATTAGCQPLRGAARPDS